MLKYLVPIVLLIAGCADSMTVPVSGRMQAAKAPFSGTATGYSDGAGVMKLALGRGRTCDGTFVYTTHRTGKGTLTCSDGKIGRFEFVAAGARGTGTGTIGDEEFTFTFGDIT